MPLTRIDDIDLYHELRGRGPRLLYISGTGGDLRRRPSVFDSLLGERFEVLAYDQRGLGRSAKPDVPYTMADYADDAAALMAHVGWDSALVVGVSFGGMVAQELALRHPDRVRRMVLACTSSGGAGGSSYPLHTLADMDPRDRVRLRLAINDVRHDAAWQARNASTFDRMITDKMAEAALNADEPGAARGARRQVEARAGHDTWDRLPTLDVPVLVCGGRFDGQATPEVVEALAARIPGAELAFFDGGHGFVQAVPEACQRIAAFLGGSSAETAAA